MLKQLRSSVTKTLISSGLYKIDLYDVQHWEKERNEDLLIYSLRKGSFYIRKEAAIALGNLKSKKALPFLAEMLTLKSPEFVLAIVTAIENIGIREYDLLAKLGAIKADCKATLEDMREQNSGRSFVKFEKKEKMERLETLREQLKRGIKRFG